jgi:3-hydroxy-9,10-secoandrosta-1,3,5(10)-triene-9,17-dione monooxygenase reductase component
MRQDGDTIRCPDGPPPSGLALDELRDALRRFVTGVTVVTGLDHSGALVGMTANSFTSVSFEPPLILVCLSCRSRSYGSLIGSGRFAINVLSDDQADIARDFAIRGGDRSTICPWRLSERGYPVLENHLTALECRLAQEHKTGDHAILVGAVEGLSVRDDDGAPLVFYGGRLFGLTAPNL